MTADQPPRPANMATIVAINQGRLPAGPDVPRADPLEPGDVAARLDDGAIALDVRAFDAFEHRHVRGSVHVSAASASFEQYVGWLVPGDAPLVLVADDPASAADAARRLAFVGLDRRVIGHVTPDAWTADGRPLESTPPIGVDRVADAVRRDAIHVLDVRERDEYDAGHVPGARHMSFKLLPTELDGLRLPEDGTIAVVCAGGLRSAIACSVLRRSGHPGARNVRGGMGAWTAAGLPVVRSGSSGGA